MTKIIAHAGCENTVGGSKENILIALEHGIDIIEVDVRAFNNVLTLSHDVIKNPEGLLSLEEVMIMVKDTNAKLNCDLKEENLIEIISELAKKHDLSSRVLLTGAVEVELAFKYNLPFFLNIEHIPNMTVTDDSLDEKTVNDLISYYNNSPLKEVLIGYNACYKCLTKDIINTFRANNIIISCWTVDDHDKIDEFISFGVDNLTTNQIIYALNNK